MKLDVKKTIFGAILWMGIQKIFDLMSHHATKLADLEDSNKLLFEVVTLMIAVFLVYNMC